MFLRALLLVLVTLPALASTEPRFCDPAKFHEYERGNNIPNIKRIHVYQLGQLTLVGMAVGGSDYRYEQSLAQQYGVAPGGPEKSCTWYANNGNDEARAAFNGAYLPRPWLRGPSVAKEYAAIMSPWFDEDATSMWSCAMNQHYVAMGCDSQMHRGPSVFAAFLAYSGCTPHHAMEIANKVWGENFVPPETREAIAAVGGAIGDSHAAKRADLQTLMTTYK